MELPLDLAESISESIPGAWVRKSSFRPWSFTGGSLRRGMSGVVSCCVFTEGGAWLRAGVLSACLQSYSSMGFFEGLREA